MRGELKMKDAGKKAVSKVHPWRAWVPVLMRNLELLHGAQWFSMLWGHKSLKSSETMNHILQKKRDKSTFTKIMYTGVHNTLKPRNSLEFRL